MEKAAARVKSGLHVRHRSAICAGMDAKTERERRLAEALRANLRRRKAQAREIDAAPRDDAPPPPSDDEPPPQ